MKSDLPVSIATDYFSSLGDPEPALKNIANAGFPYVQGVHHWK